jgi:pimeloyl-ACP methyl ester carboxylesterase
MPGASFTERYVEAAGHRIRYAQAGSGPPLVVLPTSAGLTYATGFDLLAKDFRVILLDPPGWGDSPASEESPELPALAKITAAALTAMGLQKYHLAGGSMGCIHALWLAVEDPQKVASVILEGSMAFRRDHWSMPGSDASALVAAAKQGADMTRMIPPPHPKNPGRTSYSAHGTSTSACASWPSSAQNTTKTWPRACAISQRPCSPCSARKIISSSPPSPESTNLSCPIAKP